MKKFVKDLWIISKSGIVLFEHLVANDMNPDLFGSMMSALNLYAETLSEGSISSFDIKDKRVILIREKNFLFVTKTLKKYNINQVKNELHALAQKFFKLYANELKDDEWEGGRTSTFSSFKRELNE